MDGQHIIQQYLNALGKKNGISLTLQEGVCNIQIEKEVLTLEVPENGDTLYMRAYVLTLTTEENVSRCFNILTLNYEIMHSYAATLAIDDISKKLFLCIAKPITSLDEIQFENLIFNMINLAASLQHRLLSDEQKELSIMRLAPDGGIKV